MNEQDLETRMKQSEPDVQIDPAFTARVMERVDNLPVKKSRSFWKLALAPTLLAVLIAGFVFLRPAIQKRATTSQTERQGSQQVDQQPDADQTKQAPAEQATAVDSTISNIDKQLNNLPDNDYSSANLSDDTLYN